MLPSLNFGAPGRRSHAARGALAAALLGGLIALSAPAAQAAPRLEQGAVAQIIAQAALEAQARGLPATIAVVDRLGNVLGLMRMPGANPAGVKVADNPRGMNTGLNGVVVPDTAAVIAKAVTAAFLSSAGNAFSTRTAGQIIQEHFNPGVRFTPSGPLFGVQFSQLPCSDINNRAVGGNLAGPQRSPLGLSAAPGGLPLYIGGEVVGGIAAIASGSYGIDTDIHSRQPDNDELIALAGTANFQAPEGVRADHITAGGVTLRFANSDNSALLTFGRPAPSFGQLLASGSLLVAVPGYTDGSLKTGTAYGASGSGILTDQTGLFGGGATILADSLDRPRYPIIDGKVLPTSLRVPEVTVILQQALAIAQRARAQIRQPTPSAAQVSITVTDFDGTVLGLVRTADAPLFGIDVAVQKARTTLLLSRPDAARLLSGSAGAAPYLAAASSFIGSGALSNGIALSARAVGNLARPTYPDGIDGSPNGPFSRNFLEWTPFSTGLQLDVIASPVVSHVFYVAGALAADVPTNCGVSNPALGSLLADGLQIFPGGVPIYRAGQLIGAIGVSGDGVDQDDMVAFLGLSLAGGILRNGIDNAPFGIRADMVSPRGTRLRYVNCPFAPFVDSSDNNVCQSR